MIEQKSMALDHDFCYPFSFSSSLFFLGGKRKGKKNNLSQKSCLSARSKLLYQNIYLYIYFRIKMSEELDSEDVFLATSNASFNTSYLDYNITIPDYCPVLTKRVKYI